MIFKIASYDPFKKDKPTPTTNKKKKKIFK